VESRWRPHHSPARLLVCTRHDNLVRIVHLDLTHCLHCSNCSILIPWFTVREVKVEVEIVRHFIPASNFTCANLPLSPRPKLLCSASNVACSRDCSHASHGLPLWNTTPLVLSLRVVRRSTTTLFAAYKETSHKDLSRIHQQRSGRANSRCVAQILL
jgi:hypothetical protein